MRRFTLYPRALSLALGALAMAACGGGGGGGPTPPATITFTSFQNAAVVLGQADFTSGQANRGGVVAANTLNRPGAPCQVGARLYVPDLVNNRVLGFNSVPTTDGVNADFALGQTTLSAATSGTTATTLDDPWAVCEGGGKLFVSDANNSRILIFNTLPTTSGAAADVAVGQADLMTGAAGGGMAGLAGPLGIHVVGTRLIVCDFANHRVMIWNSIPATSGANADVVLGQADFAGGAPNRGLGTPNAGTLWGPFGVWSDGIRLVVADGFNHRVLIWNTFPTTSGQNADLVLGQGSFTTNATATTALGMDTPTDVTSDGTRLIVGDCENNRILIFDAFPVASATAPSTVLGQSDFVHGIRNDDDQNGLDDGTPTARTMNTTGGFAFVKLLGSHLYSGDHRNHRALIYEAN